MREIHRDEQRGRLAMAYEAEQILAQQREEVAAEQREVANSQRLMMQGGAVDVNRLLSAQRYRLALDVQAHALAEQANRVAEEVERRRIAVVEADREVTVLDKLEERQRRQHQQATFRMEGKSLDEIAVTRWETPQG